MASSESVQLLTRELSEIFAARLQSLVVYGVNSHRGSGDDHERHVHDSSLTHTLVVVEGLTATDLRACAGRVGSWHDAGLATPLLLETNEFGRALDAFPFEFDGILSDHTVVTGSNPFAGLKVDAADLRRACEVHARGHLLHLREGYMETRGRADALAVLIVRSAAPFAALVANVARLEGRSDGDRGAAARHVERALKLSQAVVSDIVALVGVKEISSEDAERLFPFYLDAIKRLVGYIDAWRAE